MQDFELYKIVKKATGNDERIVFKVLEDTNMSYYLLLDNTYDAEGKISNVDRHTFAFPNVNVKRGDFIILYTGVGSQSSYKNKAQTVTYVFYWGFQRETSVWNEASDKAIIVRMDGVQSFKV